MSDEPVGPLSGSDDDEHLVIFFYAGDFDEAHRRWLADEPPLYRIHPEVLRLARRLAADGCRTTLVTALGEPTPLTELEPGVSFTRLGVVPHEHAADLVATIEGLQPTHFVMHFAQPELLRFADRSTDRFRSAALNASSFNGSGVRFGLRTRRTVKALNLPGIEIIANHGVPATENFRSAGVDPTRLVAYDFRHEIHPDHVAPRTLREGATVEPLLFYVGYVSEPKGVRDLIESLASPQWGSRRPRARIAGLGDMDGAAHWAQAAGVVDQVDLLGSVDNAQVQREMREADFVVIPSRPSFPEGFPLTMFEAVASRTPIVASDHPVFATLLRPGIDIESFPAGDAEALAAAVIRALDADEYRRRSADAAAVWDRLQVPLNWSTLIWEFRKGNVDQLLGDHARSNVAPS